MDIYIPIIIMIGIISIILFIIFRNYLDKHQSFSVLVAILAILATSVFNTIQFEQQSKQYILDNRPIVFVSEWIDFKTEPNTVIVSLENIGRLPARIENISQIIRLEDKIYHNESESQYTVIFPGQENFIVDFWIPPNEFVLGLGIDYYSINDVEKKNKFYYYMEYEFKFDSNKSRLIPTTRKIDAY